MIILGCGTVGMLHVVSHRREEEALQQLIGALDYMGCELQYRMTPLPQLCRFCAAEGKGPVGDAFLHLAMELERNETPSVSGCTAAVLKKANALPPITRKMMTRLGSCLGRFDVTGQLRGIENTRSLCRNALEEMSEGRTQRLRGYQTLALCAGAALAILFI